MQLKRLHFGNCGNWINAEEFDIHSSICIKERPLSVTDTNEETSLSSTVLEFSDTQQGEKPLTEFLLPNPVCAIAASSKISDTLRFLLIFEDKVAESNNARGYDHIIPEGYSFISGHYLEKCGAVCKRQKFKIMADKKAYLYKESIVYTHFLKQRKKMTCS